MEAWHIEIRGHGSAKDAEAIARKTLEALSVSEQEVERASLHREEDVLDLLETRDA